MKKKGKKGENEFVLKNKFVLFQTKQYISIRITEEQMGQRMDHLMI